MTQIDTLAFALIPILLALGVAIVTVFIVGLILILTASYPGNGKRTGWYDE